LKEEKLTIKTLPSKNGEAFYSNLDRAPFCNPQDCKKRYIYKWLNMAYFKLNLKLMVL